VFTCHENLNRRRRGREDGEELSCHSSGGELFVPRVARLSEHEGRGDEHALIARVFVSVPLVLTLARLWRAHEQHRCTDRRTERSSFLPFSCKALSGFTSYLRRIQF